MGRLGRTRSEPSIPGPGQLNRRLVRGGLLWVLSILVICGGLGTAILYPVFQSARVAARYTVALSNAKQVDLAMLTYTNDYDDRYPPELSFQATQSLLEPYLHANQDLLSAESGYSWNRALEGVDLTNVSSPAETWIFRTSKPEQNGGYLIAFADGHVKSFQKPYFQEVLRFGWDLTQFGADVHQIWQLPKEDPAEPTRQLDLTKPRDYTAITTEPGPGGIGSVMVVVRGPYSTDFNNFWVGKGTSVEIFRKTHAGAPWVATAKMADVNSVDAANDVKAITVDLLKAGKPVTGMDAILPPKAR